MAIEYERTTYRTCGNGEAETNLRFTYCTLGTEHVPKQLGTIKQIIVPNRLDDNYFGSDGEEVYLGVWKRLDSGEEIKLGVSLNTIVHTTKTLSVFEFDGIPNTGESLILGLITHPDGHYTETVEDLGGRGHVGDEDGCWVYTRAEDRRQNYTLVDIIFTVEYTVEVPDEPTPDEPDTPDTPDEPDTPDTPDEPTQDDEEENLRQVRIEEYWPMIVKNTAEFDQIAAAENPEFNNFLKCIYRALKDGFILEATEYGVERWEKMLGISPADGVSLDDRKAAILSYLSVKTPYTWRVLKQMLIGILGEDKFVMGLNNDTQELHLTFAMPVSETPMDVVEQLMERVLPMNLVVKYDYDMVVLTKIIEDGLTEMLGEDKFVVEYLNDTGKLVVHTDRADDTQLEVVTALLERVLPQNVEVVRFNHTMEISWRDWPTGYTQVEYLESTGTQGAFVMTPINKLSMLGCFSLTSWKGSLYKVFGTWYEDGSIYQMIRNTETDLKIQVGSGVASRLPQTGELIAKVDYFERKAFLNGAVIFDGFTMPATSDTVRFGILCDGSMPWLDAPRFYAYARFYHLKLWDENVLTYDLVPALDPTGAPCVVDLVSRKPFYNVGTGDFLYPTESTTYSLRRTLPDWGQLTPHGLRRLYHAPEGYTGELIDYALEHGYKPIVEPEKPEEGYWTPQWRETEEEIILEWIETEAPEQEVEQ